MIGKIVGIGVVLIVSFAIFQILMSTTPVRAIYMKIPQVAGINDSCVYNNIVDVVEATFDGNFFTAEELIGLSCSDSGARQYSIGMYLNINPSDEVGIDAWLELQNPYYNISGYPVYILSDGRYLYKHESTLLFFGFQGISDSEKLRIVTDSINEVNPYTFTQAFALLDRIPDQSSILDSSVYQNQVYLSDDLTTVLKGWYVGTSRLASQQAFIFLRIPGDIETRCWEYENETTPYGDLYLCSANDTCGPKYLFLSDAMAYAQDFDDMSFVCSSIEDAFTTDILMNVK